MPTYSLQGSGRRTIAASALRLNVAAQGGSRDVVLAARHGPVPDAAAVRSGPTLVVLPAVTRRTAVLVEPRAGLDAFPPGTVVSLTVETYPPAPDGDTVLVQPVDVSGGAARELVVLEPVGGGIIVQARDAEPDVPLPELAAAARAETRRRLRRDRVREGEGVDIDVVVDASASMVGPLADGSIGAVLEVLAGMWHVVGRDREFDVCLARGEQSYRLHDPRVADLATTATDELSNGGLGCGFRSADPELERNRLHRAVTYVVTDGPPADAADLAVAHRDQSPRHLVVLGEGRGLDVRGVPATWLPPPPAGTRAADHLLAAAAELSDLVYSLLLGCLDDGADPARRDLR